MPQKLHETARISEASAAQAKKSGRMLMQFISPGWGSSGYYSSEVLEAAADAKVIPAGTHMYADHPTELEELERPIRSIKDLMAVTVEDAYVSGGALVGEVQVVPQWRDLVETVRDAIGVSIRGEGEAVEGEAEGRRGTVFESLAAPVKSVDFVTRAGRGGKVLSVLESAAANRRAIKHGISEATVNDTREGLQTALRDAYGGDKTYVWVRDFDETTVWFEVEDGDGSGIYGQSYTSSDDGPVSLTGERSEVRVVTKYVAATRPDSTTEKTTKESEEDTMPKKEIEEAEYTRLVEDAGRVKTLESERDTAVVERDQARTELAEHRRNDRARALVTERAREADVAFTEREVKGFLADVTVKEDGSLDEEAFTKLVDEDAASKRADGGAGSVTGFGGGTGGGTSEVSEADFDAAFPSSGSTKVKEA